ncbi:hypothetical protein [Caproicibacterium sp. XB2]|uniref:hypothetical protein n=1 Tax=Caproicibacterium sp. XB2 TaxID=3388458 RepID=UPI00384E9C62
MTSLPTRERGLKCHQHQFQPLCPTVAPYTGAWIEICLYFLLYIFWQVAPYTGAWIEIFPPIRLLKAVAKVAPYTGAWIEIGPMPR